MTSPGSYEVQEVLPSLAHHAELVFNLGGLGLVAGPGQAFSDLLQLLLVLLCHGDLLLVVLETTHTRPVST